MTSQLGEEAPVARATARFVRVTPMKARRVVDLIRYLPTDEALPCCATRRSRPASRCQGRRQRGRPTPSTTCGSTRALVVSAAYVDEGPTLKRIRPRAQGRAYRINKRTCHITVEVAEVSSSTELAGKSRTAAAAPASPAPASQQQSNTRGGTR
jgi:large subunit ribosomal protein L22